LPHIRAGKLKVYAVTAKQRTAAAPDIPTTAEAGFPGIEVAIWHGLWAHKTPQPIIDKLNAAIVGALKDPAVFNRLTELGAVVRPSTPAEFAAVMKADEESIGDLAKRGLLKAD